jgi:hypothetical protein
VPRTKKPLICSTLALMFAMVSGGGAAARHHGHSGYVRQTEPDNVVEAMRGPVLRGGPLGVMMTQFIHDCEQQAAELKNFPADEIAQSVALDDSQADALKKLQSVAHEAADGLTETCPPAVPANPADRLDMIEREIDGIDAAVKALLPAIKVLYGSLSDDQKAHLVLRFAGLEGRRNVPQESSGSARRAIEHKTRRRSKKSGDDYGDTPPPPRSQARWNCEQWQAELRGWPVERVEQSVAVGPRQRAAFYELAAAVQHAADTFDDFCPQDISVTPLARIDDLKKKLDTLRKSIATIRPALIRFYEVLDGGQKNRFNDAI